MPKYHVNSGREGGREGGRETGRERGREGGRQGQETEWNCSARGRQDGRKTGKGGEGRRERENKKVSSEQYLP